MRVVRRAPKRRARPIYWMSQKKHPYLRNAHLRGAGQRRVDICYYRATIELEDARRLGVMLQEHPRD